jgi:hypothetical protein
MQLVWRISGAELQVMSCEPSRDHDMASTFRREKAAVLRALLSRTYDMAST